jgi:GDSL-like Lipase/Acylhydrolase family
MTGPRIVLARALSPAARAALGIVALGLIPAAILFKAAYLYWSVYLSLTTLLALAALLTGRVVWGIQSHQRLRSRLQGMWTSALALIIVLMALEAFCRVFVAWSDGFVVTLSERGWLRRYWQPVNTLGYRDMEWSPAALAGRTRVLAVGDSVTAGAGLEGVGDRYQDQLGAMLGDHYAVMTAAQIGWDSAQELSALESYPYPPDVVILTYSVNDIDSVAAAHGVGVAPTFSLRDTPLFPLISTSHSLNFAYYTLLRLPVWGSNAAVRSYQHAAYTDPLVWDEQMRLLRSFSDWSRAHHAQLIVVATPDINSPVTTAPYTRQVADFFEGLGGVTVLDLGPELSARDPRQMAVSAMDAHPNPATQRLFALRLCPLIAGLPGLPPVSCPPVP